MNEKTFGFREERHTADCAVLIWAATLEQLFIEAAKAFYATMKMETILVEPAVERFIELEAMDTESLIVAFLSELLFFAEDEKTAFDIQSLELNGFQLKAKMNCRRVIRIEKEVKAVTYHEMALEWTGERYQTRIVFDL